jgi:hypothetical protein
VNTKTKTPAATEYPLAGGDYIDKGDGLKQVSGSTAPMPGKSEAAESVPAIARKPAPVGKPDAGTAG